MVVTCVLPVQTDSLSGSWRRWTGIDHVTTATSWKEMRRGVTVETVLVFVEGGGWEGVRGDGCSSDRMTGVTEIVARWGTW